MMIGPHSILEQQIANKNFKLAKELVKLSKTSLFISAHVLKDLLISGLEEKSLAIYLMENCPWDPIQLKSIFSDQNQWNQFLNQNPKLFNFPQIQMLFRTDVAIEDLQTAIQRQDTTSFEEKFRHHLQESSYLARTIHCLPYSYATEIKENFPEAQEYLSLQLGDDINARKTILNKTLETVSLNDPAILAKHLELGVQLELFLNYINGPRACKDITLEQWCLDNDCEYLLELDHVQRQIEELKDKNEVNTWFNHLRQQEPNKQDIAHFKILLENYAQKHAIPPCVMLIMLLNMNVVLESPWEFCVRMDMPEILSMPGMMPQKEITNDLKTKIFQCMYSNRAETSEVLIKHAQKYMPSALQFSSEERRMLAGNSLLRALDVVRNNKKPAQALSYHGSSSDMPLVEEEEVYAEYTGPSNFI